MSSQCTRDLCNEEREPFESTGRSPSNGAAALSEPYGVVEQSDIHAGAMGGHFLEANELGESDDSKDRTIVKAGAVLDVSSPLLSTDRSFRTDEPRTFQRNRKLAVDLTYDNDGVSLWESAKRVLRNLGKSFTMMRLFLSLAWTDIKNRTCSYCLGFFSVFLVVLLCVLMISLLTNMPILFLRLSEATRGEYDLRIAPGGVMESATSINYTILEEMFPATNSIYGLHAPRIEDVFGAQKVKSCPGKTASTLWYSNVDGSVCRDQRTCMSQCSSINATVVRLVAINASAEERMGFGTQYHEPTLGAGEIILSHRAALLMGGAEVGDELAVYGDVRTNLQQAFVDYTENTTDAIMVYTIVAIMGRDERKFPNYDAFVVVAYDTYLTDVAKGLKPTVSSENVAAVANANPKDCTSFVYFIMEPAARLKAYRSTSYNTIRRQVVNWASGILSPLGFLQVSPSAPQLRGLWGTRLMSVFLGLIISVILLALAFLSVVLIYTLLTVGVETKTYELGVQRMIGFTKEDLVVLVLSNAYFFTIPAWVIGIAAGQAVYIGIRQLFISLIAVTLPIGVTGASVGWATLAGLGIPIIASFFPILSLITLQLPDALNTSRSRNIGVVFKITRGGASQLNGTMFGLGLLLFVFGFLVYYLFPTGLIVMNLSLIFYIFFAVLIGLLGGFVLLTLNFERVCQVCVAYLLLFWESRAVFSFMQKSLSAHRRRNRKTTLMYSLSLAFVIFITVAVQIMLISFQYSERQQLGCEVMVSTGGVRMRHYVAVDEALSLMVAEGGATAYTYEYAHPRLTSLSTQTLDSLGRYRSSSTTVSPLPPKYFEVLESSFLLIHKVDPLVQQYGMTGSLYTEQGMHKGVMSYGAADYLGVGNAAGVVLLDFALTVNTTSGATAEFREPARPIATLELAPVQTMSKYDSDSGNFLVAIPSLFHQINAPYESVLGGTVTYIRLRVPRARLYSSVSDTMVSLLSSLGYTAAVTTITEKTQDMTTAGNILNLFFILAELMILIICFFSLMSSMTTNVLNSSKEIGVLLCMGMTHFQLYRVYVWEAFILVVSSGITGLFVGLIVAYTMLLQQILFSQINLPFPFPYTQLLIVVAVGFVSALASSVSPVAYLLRSPSVTHILRRSAT